MREITERNRHFKYLNLTVIVFGYNGRHPEEVELMDGNGNRIVLSGRPRRVASKMRKIAGWLERLSKKNISGVYASTDPDIRFFNNLKITVWPITVWPVTERYSLIELYGPSGDDSDSWQFMFLYAKLKQVAREFYKIADWLERV
jgi:hypothetical protein